MDLPGLDHHLGDDIEALRGLVVRDDLEAREAEAKQRCSYLPHQEPG